MNSTTSLEVTTEDYSHFWDFLAYVRWTQNASRWINRANGVICVLGVIGNVLNAFVLGYSVKGRSLQRMEKCAYIGLLSLAVSDLLYCICMMPMVVLDMEILISSTYNFTLFYKYVNGSIRNIFLFSSTWLTVTIAASRFYAICRPFKARQFIGKKFTLISTGIVFIIAVIISIPRFFLVKIEKTGNDTYERKETDLSQDKLKYYAYHWVSFIAGVMIPFILLVIFNIGLTVTLRRTTQQQTTIRVSGPAASSSNTRRITVIFIVIIVCYFLLVIPGEVHAFTRIIATHNDDTTDDLVYNLIFYSLRFCQSVNFAFNFVLYMIVNTSFQRKFFALIKCKMRSIQEDQVSSDETCTTKCQTAKMSAAKSHVGKPRDEHVLLTSIEMHST